MFQRKWLIYGGVGVTVLLILALVLAVIFTGNGSSNPGFNRTTPINLTWWVSEEEVDFYEDVFSEYQKLNDNALLEIEIVEKNLNDNLFQDFLEATALGTGPDIIQINSLEVDTWLSLLSPIEVFQGSSLSDYRNSFVDVVNTKNIHQEQVYGVSLTADNLQLYYNPEILSQSSLPLPPQTWQELDNQIDALSRLDETGNNFTQSAIALGTGPTQNNSLNTNIDNYLDILATLIYQSGGEIFNPVTRSVELGNNNSENIFTDLQASELDDNPAFSAISFYRDFARNNSTRYSWNHEQDNAQDLFAQGKMAYIIGYSSLEQKLTEQNPNLNFEISPLPQLNPNQKATFARFDTHVLTRNLSLEAAESTINSLAKAKYGRAQEFMFYLASSEVQEKYAAEFNTPGVDKTVIQSQIQSQNNIRIFAEANLFAQSMHYPDLTKTRQIWGNMLYRNAFENQSLSNSFNQMQKEYTELVRKVERNR